MQIDFGEKWIEVAGERVKAFVFVATLGYSRCTFARVYPTLRQRHWLEGLEAAVRHFGGVPEECVVDNAKALVLRWQGDRPVFHPEFQAFCHHWGMRPRACPERVNDFETGSGLSYRSDPPAAESRRGHGQPADCLAATGRWPALRVLSLTTAPWKTLRVSHTSPQKAISSIMRQFPFSVG